VPLPEGRFRAGWYDPTKGKRYVIRDAAPLVLDRPTAYTMPARPHPERDWVLLIEGADGGSDNVIRAAMSPTPP
jgi:hypothetical protein